MIPSTFSEIKLDVIFHTFRTHGECIVGEHLDNLIKPLVISKPLVKCPVDIIDSINNLLPHDS